MTSSLWQGQGAGETFPERPNRKQPPVTSSNYRVSRHRASKADPLPLDSRKTRGDPALEQRPVEAERNGKVAALDHGIGLLGTACRAADRHAAFEDAVLGTRDQRL